MTGAPFPFPNSPLGGSAVRSGAHSHHRTNPPELDPQQLAPLLSDSSAMFAKLAVTAALCGAIVMGGTEAKKKGPTITNKVFFDIEIGATHPSRRPRKQGCLLQLETAARRAGVV